MQWQSIDVSFLQVRDNQCMGVITLNTPQTLNALSMQMIDELQRCLQEFEKNPQVVCVWLQGAGEKAFCAGGDIRSFYDYHQAQPAAIATFAQDFFRREYALDYYIHTYSKPFICWADGIVMGGGVGLMAGADFRIVTERTLWAMPEIQIGLFPDVGGSWFLQRLPTRLGLWLGLTASRLKAPDLLWTGLCDDYVTSSCKQDLLQKLQTLPFQGDKSVDCQQIDRVLSHWDCHLTEPGWLLRHQEEIHALVRGFSLADISYRFSKWHTDVNEINQGIEQFFNGSAISCHLVWAQYNKARYLSLSEVFATELNLAVHCCIKGDFLEGVRALLVDKDKNPKWQFKAISDVPEDFIESFYQ